MRYSTAGNIETEFEPGSTVLKNKPGIRSKRRMDALEFEALCKTQEHFFGSITPTTKITCSLILAIHKHFLGRLYAWAGRYRTVNLSKSGFTWPPANRVPQNMATFERETLNKFTPCRPGPLDNVARAIAIVHAELLLIHPFREGNGRIARLIADIMALQAGFPPPDFDFRPKGNQHRYIEAVKRGYLEDYRQLTNLIMEAIRKSTRRGERP